MTPMTYDIYWTVGFLEGEGSFTKCGGTVMVSATQVQKWPIDKLYELYGGGINTFSRKEVTGNIYYRWCLYGKNAVEFMLETYHLYSPKRKQQIQRALKHWAPKPGRVCGVGGMPVNVRKELVNRINVLK